MKIKLQERKLANGKKSLLLSYYRGNRKHYEFLKLYLVPERTKLDKQLNKNTYQLAEKVQAQRIVELQNKTFGYKTETNFKRNFMKYFDDQVEQRYESGSNYSMWRSTQKHLMTFTKGYLTMDMITQEWMKKFRTYLESCLSPNSSNSYFNVLKHGIHNAVDDGYLLNDSATRVKATPLEESNRVFLTIEEIRILSNSECKDYRLKKAFLFSCLTGLRISDIQRVQWENLTKNSEGEYEISLYMKKTKRFIIIPINTEAVNLLGDIKKGKSRIFPGIKYSAHLNHILASWVLINGIQKHITWHSSRHTYACLLIKYGADIYTVSKLLGHKDIKTTQIYAKVMDETII